MQMMEGKSVKGCVRRCFQWKTLRNRLPCLLWIPSYNLASFVSDFVAGLTVGMMIIPQGIAMSVMAGLPVQYGLYSAMGCGFVYCIFGTVKNVNIGPTTIMSLLTYEYASKGRDPSAAPDYVTLLSFLTGSIITILALLRLEILLDFVPHTVISAFVSAGAVTIATSQVKDLLGLKIKTSGFVNTWFEVFSNMKESNPWDVIMGLVCIALLILLKNLTRFGGEMGGVGKSGYAVRKTLWFLMVGRNALVVIIAASTAYACSTRDHQPFTIVGDVESGLPGFALPPFSTTDGEEKKGFWDMISDFGMGLWIVPLVATLDAVAIAKAFAHGKIMQGGQEMLALGLVNILGGFLSSMPTASSFSRSAVNRACDIRSPFGSVVASQFSLRYLASHSGLVVILALTVLTPSFYYIPRTSLSAVMISAVVFMVEYEEVINMWKTSRRYRFSSFPY
ncbi:unnamed protein product [Darwinula stevensoni]|uniref:SLC26A/SulP transporter domain-containing protein n=1 Tax=Darwinula stevensoni TaxID=69355 RepID=A0A7R9FNR6_9CRUS|nr:unnamed protein product [Darwinula stevensoni]CAG0897108.1 unnamed protein product [Darwinula stevensoni]